MKKCYNNCVTKNSVLTKNHAPVKAAPASRNASAVLKTLIQRGFPAYLHSFSAIDAYLGRSPANETLVLTGADTADLARIFIDIRFPGIDLADAALDADGQTYYFRCVDFDAYSGQAERFLFTSDFFKTGESLCPSFKILAFYRDCRSNHFLDPYTNYPLLRDIKKGLKPELQPKSIFPGAERCRAVMDWALILAKYFPVDDMQISGEKPAAAITGNNIFQNLDKGTSPCIEEQRVLLKELLSGPNPAAGLDFLMCQGFIAEYWPELAVLNDVDHSKEFHPEGNVWKHTLETFRYRKASAGTFDLRLSLGLLLHDIGKAVAEAAGKNRFDGHAELGEQQASRFLRRLGFEPALVSDVCYLVKNHMLPAALPRLPLIRTEDKMLSPLFPVLMELYRCDESSSFKGPDGYYQSSAAYQSFLRNKRNPYRTADGKKHSDKRRSKW